MATQQPDAGVTVPAIPEHWSNRDTLAEVYVLVKSLHDKVDGLRAYVEQIEKEAHEAMGGLTDPDNMMKMAGQFLGMSPKA